MLSENSLEPSVNLEG
jgi:hypothetical protein